MKIILTEKEGKGLYINSFGYENIWHNAHWGKGSREVYILHYIIKGEGFFNGKKVKEGQGFFIKKGMLHEYYSSKNNPWNYFWVTFSGEIAEDICKKHILYNEDLIFDFDFKTELLNLYDSILSEEKTISHLRAVGYFYFLLSFHVKESKKTPNFHVKKAKEYINLNFHRNISITEIAQALNLSDRYLYNLFIKYEGVSPKKYLNQLRINRSKNMLLNTNCSVTQIAVSNGFSDVLAFSRFFSKHTGLSPINYRKRID